MATTTERALTNSVTVLTIAPAAVEIAADAAKAKPIASNPVRVGVVMTPWNQMVRRMAAATERQCQSRAMPGRMPLWNSLQPIKFASLPKQSLRFGVEIAITRGAQVIGAKGAPVAKLGNDEFDPKAFLAKVGTGKTILKVEKNQHVFKQGDVASAVFYIQKGNVKLTVLSEQGKEAVVGILEPGQFFGEGCLNGHPLRIATTTAMEECVITSITKEAMIAALHNEPKFSEMFMAYLLTRNSRVEEDLIDQLFNSSEKRLARLLLLLAHFGKEGRPQPILLDMSQETLAEMIGTTRSRVSYFMNKFRKLGLISYNGKIEVHNSLLNAVLHEKPEIERDDPS
jgi:CRP-like cAMP-binding protein